MLPSRLTSIWKAAHTKQNTACFTFVEDDTRGIWLLGASRNSGFSSSTPVCGPNPNYRKRGAFATEAPQCGGTVSKPDSVSPGYSVRSSMPSKGVFLPHLAGVNSVKTKTLCDTLIFSTLFLRIPSLSRVTKH